MSRLRLNAAAIRSNDLPVKPPDALSFDDLVARPFVLSRRDFVAVAGLTVAAGAVAARSLEPILEAEMGTLARGAWLRAGQYRAVIDPALFGGAPRLTVANDGGWYALLTGARFPGTSLPAGIELAVLGSGALARLHIRHEIGGFEAEVPLASWLAGEAAATSIVRLDGLKEFLGDGYRLSLAGLATATLGPDWSLKLEGREIAHLAGFGRDIVADTVTIALAPETASTLLSRRVARRALITLESGGRTWALEPPALGGARTLSFAPGALDRITVESAETRAGAVHRALVAFSASGGRASYLPDSRKRATAAVIALGSVRVAKLLDGSGTFHVGATFTDPQWARVGAHTLLVGGAEWAKPFEAWGDAGAVKVDAEPAVLGVAAPFDGAIASPIVFPESARSTVRLGEAVGTKTPGTVASAVATGKTIVIPPESYVTITRPDDMLTLRFVLFNLSLVAQRVGPSKLVRTDPQQFSFISVVFPGQHVLERAYMNTQTPGPAPFQAYLADDSQLAFTIPAALADAGIPYTVDGLLDWSEFSHNVVPAARATVELPDDMKRLMRQPYLGSTYYERHPETFLELPWGLYLSPEPTAFWKHRTTPLTSHDRTELWHTQLHGAPYWVPIAFADGQDRAASGANGDGIVGPGPFVQLEKSPTLRAVWSRHYDVRLQSDNPIPDAPISGMFRNSFSTTQQDGETIITSSPYFPYFTVVANDVGGIKERWSITDLSGRYHDNPIDVNNLLLTSMGAWLDSRAAWKTDEIALTKSVATELMQWDHRMTMGRDQYVKIVLFGRLFPFGHRAVKVVITERKVKKGNPFAFLEQRTYIMVREPVLTFSNDGPPIDRALPFKKVELKTLQTQPISESAVPGVTLTADAFWPHDVTSGADIQWSVEATDWDDVVHKFTMPLVYVRGFVAGKYDSTVSFSAAEPILNACAAAVRGKEIGLSGQSIAYAKNVAGSNADKARVMPTNWMKFDAGVYDPAAGGAARFYPKMHQANVHLDALEEMTNQTAGTTIRIAEHYRNLGFSGANAAGRVFAEIVTAPIVGFPAELSGALATPLPVFSGISANKGAFGGDLAQFGSGEFRPDALFDALNAKLVGGITLIEVLEEVLGLDNMPSFDKVRDALDTDTLVVQFDWETPVKSGAGGLFVAGAGGKLKLHAEIRKKLKDATAPPSSVVRGELGPFTLQLVQPAFDAIHISFEVLSFESVDGGSLKVNPVISDVEFVGVLKYLQTLSKYLGALGGGGSGGGASIVPGSSTGAETVVDSGPLKIDVTTAGITASLSLQLPDVTVGVFSLKNMSFFAGLTLPFSGDPVTLDFAFCSRESPFELLVMGFGGGGYVLMQLTVHGMRSLEISLEFGAGTTLDIGVASGSIEIKGGFTLRYEKTDTGGDLTFLIFIRIRGALEVLGLITVTITFYLELKYHSFTCPNGNDGDELTGTATLTIEIEILFFSTSVELSVTKTLAGSDPRFADLMPAQSDWDDYCAAFASARLGA